MYMSSFSETADDEVTTSVTCYMCSKESRLLRTLSNCSRGCQTLINLRRAASSRTHLVLQAYCLTDVDEINPLGIEIWYRTTRRFSKLDSIEAIRSVPKKYRTRYLALHIHTHREYTPGAVGSHLCCSVRGAVGGSVPCSRAPRHGIEGGRVLYIHSPHLQSLPAQDSKSQPFNYKSDSLTIGHDLPLPLWPSFFLFFL